MRTPRLFVSFFAVALLAISLVSGCNTSDEYSGMEDSGLGDCTTSDDCEADQFCVDDQCIECFDQSDCEEGVCADNGVCVACTEDGDCADGESCVGSGADAICDSGSSENNQDDPANNQDDPAPETGEITVEVTAPSSQTIDFEITDVDGDVAETFEITGDGTASFDLDVGTYTVEVSDTITDEWDNEFVFSGTGESFEADSDQAHTQTISTHYPSLVFEADDDADLVGTLRETVGRVNDDTEITFSDDLNVIELDESINIEKPLRIVGPSDDHIGITQSEDEGDPLFIVDYEGSGDELIRFEGLELFDVEGDYFAGYAAGIQAPDLTDATLEIVDCKFHDIETVGLITGAAVSVSSSGGSVTIEGSEFIGSKAFGHGPALHLEGSSDTEDLFSIIDSHFEGNESTDRDGGALLLRHATVTIEDSHFEDNHADGHGGAIRSRPGTELTITDTTFLQNNSGDRGGAIFSQGDFYGQSLFVQWNTANNGGGGLSLMNGIGSLEDSVIYGNDAENSTDIGARGGGIQLDRVGDGFSEPFELHRLLIENNEAALGGGLYVGGDEDEDTFVNIVNTSVMRNSTIGSGGAGVQWQQGAWGWIQYSTIVEHKDCFVNAACFFIGTRLATHEDSNTLHLQATVIDGANETSLVSRDSSTNMGVRAHDYNKIADVHDVYSSGFSVDGDGNDTSADIEFEISPSYSQTAGTDNLSRTASLDSDSAGYQAIPSGECNHITSWGPLMISNGDEPLTTDQAGNIRPGHCTSGAWQPGLVLPEDPFPL